MLFLVGGVVLLTFTHPQLTTTTLGVVPIVVGLAFFFGRRLRRASTGLQDRVAQSLGMANEAFAQIRTVQSFVREEEETRRFGSLLSGVVEVAVARAKMRATLFGIVGFVAFAAVVVVLWQGGRLVLAGALTPGALVSFLLLAITVAAAVGSLVSLFGSYQEAVGAAQRVFDLLALQPTVAEPVHPVPLRKPVRGAVGLEHVRFRYAPELHEVLTDVTFTIAPGEVVALVGPSGAGKTTVASLIPRFWDVTEGRITLDGVDVRHLSFADLRGAIGLVPQEPALFSGSVRDNIAYGKPGATDDEVLRRRARRARARVHRASAGRHGDARRRARGQAFWWATAAHRAGADLPQGSRRRRARRSDVEPGQRVGAAGRGGDGGAARADGAR